MIAQVHLDDGNGGSRHAQQPFGSLIVRSQYFRARGRRRDLRRSRVRHGEAERAERYRLDDAETHAQLVHSVGKLAPAEVGLGTRQDEQVALACARCAHRNIRPCQRLELTVDDVEHRPARAIVDEEIAVEGRDLLPFLGDLVRRSRRRRGRVDPPVERRDEHRRAQRRLGRQRVKVHLPQDTVPAQTDARPIRPGVCPSR